MVVLVVQDAEVLDVPEVAEAQLAASRETESSVMMPHNEFVHLHQLNS